MELQYGEHRIVFDRDRVVLFDQIIETAKQKGVNVGWSNPCIEIWFDLNRYGNEMEAIKIAESRLTQYLRGGIDKPSEMCPCTTMHRLISEIREKVEPYK